MIDNLEEKLEGKLPVTQNDLFKLVDSHGRINNVLNCLRIKKCDPDKCYNLSKLDVSNVKDFSFLFYNSMFNGDINKWNVSNSNSFVYMFSKSYFNGDISNWNFNENSNCDGIFYVAEAFKKKYNDGDSIDFESNKFLKWFEENRKNISFFNISKEEALDINNYLDAFNLDNSKNNLVVFASPFS